ncbi:hypothetical protein C3H57_04125 [Campylobacter jejuni]|uniref:Uncharacterized protein n=2 Tax=Campylobacter jejuni TaxID=197 RepID=A0A431EEE8_CAMJU|nr:hypothetical protein C3H57_04125 [Campylobacter jejuni]
MKARRSKMDINSLLSRAGSVSTLESEDKKFYITTSIKCMVDLDVQLALVKSELDEDGKGRIELEYSESKLADTLLSAGIKDGEFGELTEVIEIAIRKLVKSNITGKSVKVESWKWLKPRYIEAFVGAQ